MQLRRISLNEYMATWYASLITDSSAAGLLVGVTVSGAVGMLLGAIRVMGVSLGVAGALFAGIAWDLLVWQGNRPLGAPSSHNPTLEFLRDFGLILFVYAIGLMVGPGFFDRLRAHGLRWNLLAVLVITLGALVAAAAWWLMALPGSLVVGLLAGATTNTPSLAAAGQALGTLTPEAQTAARELAAAGYAIAYPLGIVGIIATLIVVRKFARADIVEPVATSILERRALLITNSTAIGSRISELRLRAGGKVLVSRLARGDGYVVPGPELLLERSDVVLAVGAPLDLDALEALCGERSPRDLLTEPGELQIRNMLVSEKRAALHILSALDPGATHAVTVTRIVRAGVELLATDGVALHLGDRLRVVGTAEALERFARVVGDSAPALEHANLVPFLTGILLGVILGSIPIAIPGLPAALKLGLAGGTLFVALLVAARGRLGRADVYLPSATILFMKEFGIVLFLSCVGLLSGEAFLRTVTSPDGPMLIGIGALITVLPLAMVAFVALLWRRSYGEIAGLLAGGMTDPPALAFAQSTANSEVPARIYATVYPLTMLLRIACAQVLMLLLT